MDVSATNLLARALYEPISSALPDRPDTARHLFFAEDARDFWGDADYFAGAFAARLRLESAANAFRPRLTSLVTELTEHSALFREHWANFEVNLFRNGIKRFVHPVAGRLDLHFATMGIACLPADRHWS